MSRVRLNTTVDEELLLKAREMVAAQGLDGVNDVVEKALKIFFQNCTATVWERERKGGWIQKLVVRPDRGATFESIRVRKPVSVLTPKYYSPEALESKGWIRKWVCRI
jgi:hypothetical protein